MRPFRHRRLERRLREERPLLAPELRAAFEARIDRRTARTRGRLVAVALVAGVAVAVASTGGLGYAASGARQTVKSVKRVFVASGPQVQKTANAGRDQYQPGFAFGDPNHNHAGAPEVQKTPTAPPAPRRRGGALVVSTSMTLSEQAVLHVSVIGPGGQLMTISQSGSTIGGEPLSGPPAKTIRFVVLVPRTIDISLSVPLGESDLTGLTIRVVAVDVEGNRTTATEPLALAPEALSKVEGTARSDTVPASVRSDTISTGGGNDVINTGSGDDVVSAGAGNDTITAPAGNNRIHGGPGDDRVKTGGGADRIVGGPGRDVIRAGAGNDTIITRDRDRDFVNGGPGRDTCIVDRLDVLISCEIVRVG